MGIFTGKTVLITGAAGGIGQHLSRQFAAEGAAIAALDRADTVTAFAETLQSEGFKAAGAVADIADVDAVRAAVASLRDAVGPISVLVNNAGFSNASALDDTTPETWATDVAGNLNGAYNCVDAVTEDLKADGNGAIVNISSVNGLAGYGDPAYSAAKAGLINYTKTLAMEYGRFGIRANAICPGTVRTPIWDHRIARNPNILQELEHWYPLKRIVEPSEVASVAVFLASPAANAVSGAVIPVDCGLTAGNRVMTEALTLEEI